MSVLLRRAIGWLVTLECLLLGTFVIAVFGGTDARLHAPAAVVAAIVGGGIPIVASLIATRNPRRAGRLSLWVTPVAPLLVILFPSWEFGGIRTAIAIFVGVLIIPGLFWRYTARRSWPLPLPFPFLPRKPLIRAVILSGFFCVIAVIAVLLSCCLPWWCPICDCYGRPLLTEQGVPRNIDFTAKILFVGPATFRLPSFRWSLWSIAHVEQRFSGLPSWAPNILILRGYFLPSDKGQQYFVEGGHSQGAITHFLPIIEPVICGRTGRVDRSAVALRILHDGPPKSGVRVIGRVFDKLVADPSKPVPGIEVVITGPTGRTGAVTDAQGIYDVTGLPPGQYTVEFERWKTAYDLKAGGIGEDTFYIH